MLIEKKLLKDLKPAPYNPRQSTAKQEAQLKRSLEKFGVVEPIIWNKQTGYIVGGHFRVRELHKLGYKEIDCVIVDLNEEDEKELNIRLNANTGEWDWEQLANEWDEDKLNEWGLDVPTIENTDTKIDEEQIVENEQSVQLIPSQEYLLVIFENDMEFEQAKLDLKLKMVRRGGYKKGSEFDAVSLERVLKFQDLKERLCI